MTPLVQKIAKRTPDAHTFMWFDIGQIKPETVELVLDSERVTHLPFDRTAVVGSDRLGWEFGLVLFGGNGSVFCFGWSFGDKNWEQFVPFGWAHTEEGLKLLASNRPLPPRDSCLRTIAIVDMFLTQLENAGTQAYRASIAETHLNRVRMAKNKPPFSINWNTVVVGPTKPSLLSKGGTHASPRQHQRRGHWRTRGDKRYWVRQATVGKAENGITLKDYMVRAMGEK